MANKTLNILFVGNSYTYYNQMPEDVFTRLAEKSGYKVSVTSVTRGAVRSVRSRAVSNSVSQSRVH